ncbi:hypothetical protein [Stutzerimonas xanthomarina]|uniref:hypothetical protein n=1 Tax=Stutzerimonas xanthomarina TaxID=271420 RepID=UPI003AA9B910
MPASLDGNDHNAVIRFAVKHYFNNDPKKAAAATGWTTDRIKGWMTGRVRANAGTARYFMSRALIPEFRVVCEHSGFNGTEKVAPQIRAMLNGHHDHPGVYAFYDALCQLVYVGKANSSLQTEIISALSRRVETPFPKTAKRPASRREIVKYISAYDVGGQDHSDYPRHVEALLLRISKPLLNKQVGRLTSVMPPQPDLTD